jgi:hypothetical protein
VNTTNVVVAVTTNPPPIITISPNSAAICPGTTVNLLASGASTYLWSPQRSLCNEFARMYWLVRPRQPLIPLQERMHLWCEARRRSRLL